MRDLADTLPRPKNSHRLRGLRWRGAKSNQHNRLLGRWIAGLIPPAEFVNDLDGDLINWWRTVRDCPAELTRMLAATPYSRDEHAAACQILADGDLASALERAWAFTVACEQGSPIDSATFVAVRRAHSGVGMNTAWARVAALAERMKQVVIENVDALDLLASVADNPAAIIYADPPYLGTLGYEHTVDHDLLVETLRAQQGTVAVSGFAGDFDELNAAGWSMRSLTRQMRLTDAAPAERVECLWMNYEPAEGMLFDA